MELVHLYDRAAALWPVTLNLSECTGPDDPIWSLVDAHDAIEARIGSDEIWLKIAAYSFHQAIFETARARMSAGLLTIKPGDVSIDMFEACLKDNLEQPSWETELEIYLRHNPKWPTR